MTAGIFRDVEPATLKMLEEGYQEPRHLCSAKNDPKVSLLVPKTSFEKDWTSEKSNELRLIYGLTFE